MPAKLEGQLTLDDKDFVDKIKNSRKHADDFADKLKDIFGREPVPLRRATRAFSEIARGLTASTDAAQGFGNVMEGLAGNIKLAGVSGIALGTLSTILIRAAMAGKQSRDEVLALEKETGKLVRTSDFSTAAEGVDTLTEKYGQLEKGLRHARDEASKFSETRHPISAMIRHLGEQLRGRESVFTLQPSESETRLTRQQSELKDRIAKQSAKIAEAAKIEYEATRATVEEDQVQGAIINEQLKTEARIAHLRKAEASPEVLENIQRASDLRIRSLRAQESFQKLDIAAEFHRAQVERPGIGLTPFEVQGAELFRQREDIQQKLKIEPSAIQRARLNVQALQTSNQIEQAEFEQFYRRGALTGKGTSAGAKFTTAAAGLTAFAQYRKQIQDRIRNDPELRKQLDIEIGKPFEFQAPGQTELVPSTKAPTAPVVQVPQPPPGAPVEVPKPPTLLAPPEVPQLPPDVPPLPSQRPQTPQAAPAETPKPTPTLAPPPEIPQLPPPQPQAPRAETEPLPPQKPQFPKVETQPLPPQKPQSPEIRTPPLPPQKPQSPEVRTEPLPQQGTQYPEVKTQPLPPQKPRSPEVRTEPLPAQEPQSPEVRTEPLPPQKPQSPEVRTEPLPPQKAQVPQDVPEELPPQKPQVAPGAPAAMPKSQPILLPTPEAPLPPEVPQLPSQQPPPAPQAEAPQLPLQSAQEVEAPQLPQPQIAPQIEAPPLPPQQAPQAEAALPLPPQPQAAPPAKAEPLPPPPQAALPTETPAPPLLPQPEIAQQAEAPPSEEPRVSNKIQETGAEIIKNIPPELLGISGAASASLMAFAELAHPQQLGAAELSPQQQVESFERGISAAEAKGNKVFAERLRHDPDYAKAQRLAQQEQQTEAFRKSRATSPVAPQAKVPQQLSAPQALPTETPPPLLPPQPQTQAPTPKGITDIDDIINKLIGKPFPGQAGVTPSIQGPNVPDRPEAITGGRNVDDIYSLITKPYSLQAQGQTAVTPSIQRQTAPDSTGPEVITGGRSLNDIYNLIDKKWQ